jgi:signal peptidase II
LAKKSTIILTTVSVVYILDRLTKLAIIENFGLDQSHTVVAGYFDVTYIRNTGAAFGILSFLDDSFRLPFFLVTTLAAIAMLVYFIIKTRPGDVLTLIALALIIGGALGNMTDRQVYGYVIDFIDWHVGGHHWPAFNIADSGITVGVSLLGIEIFLRGKPIGVGNRP